MNCKNCGKEFKPKRKENTSFCCRNCAYQSLSKRLKKELEYYIDTNNCWICISHAPIGKGLNYYPRFYRGGKRIKISKYIYQKYKGEIPDNMIVRHTCDNPRCINPEHLLLGTIRDNARDMVERDRSLRGEKHPSAKITNEIAIKIKKDNGHTLQELATMYNISQSIVFGIRHRLRWKHI